VLVLGAVLAPSATAFGGFTAKGTSSQSGDHYRGGDDSHGGRDRDSRPGNWDDHGNSRNDDRKHDGKGGKGGNGHGGSGGGGHHGTPGCEYPPTRAPKLKLDDVTAKRKKVKVYGTVTVRHCGLRNAPVAIWAGDTRGSLSQVGTTTTNRDGEFSYKGDRRGRIWCAEVAGGNGFEGDRDCERINR
jgi:hypothetical protein